MSGRPQPSPCESASSVSTTRGPRTRVLVVASTLHIGGAEQVAANLARYLDRSRFDVTACFLKENGIVGRQMLEQGVDLVPIPGWRPGRDYLTSLKLMRLIRSRQIQVVHTHDIHGLMDASLCRMIYPRFRHVHTFHWGNYPERDARYARIERALWRIPDALVAVGHTQARAIRDFYRIPEDRLRVIWNGIAPQSPEIHERVRSLVDNCNDPVIGSVSTLIPQKGIEYLLQAAHQLMNKGHRFLMLIAGEGKLRPALEQQSSELGLDSCVKFLGWVPEASRQALPACDIFVQSSLWEAMSVVVLEAMAASKPIVATNVGENSRVLVDKECALVVAPRDATALAQALESLLVDSTLGQRLAQSARDRFGQHFTIERMIENHQAMYSELVRADSHPSAAEAPASR